jgi:uncharacterized protein (DUF305 family)
MRSLMWRLVRPSLIIIIPSLFISASVVRIAPRPAHAAAMPFDQQFIDMMIPHHQGTTATATIALNRSNHSRVKALAQ